MSNVLKLCRVLNQVYMYGTIRGWPSVVATCAKCMARNTICNAQMPTVCKCRFIVILHYYSVLCSYYIFI